MRQLRELIVDLDIFDNEVKLITGRMQSLRLEEAFIQEAFQLGNGPRVFLEFRKNFSGTSLKNLFKISSLAPLDRQFNQAQMLVIGPSLALLFEFSLFRLDEFKLNFESCFLVGLKSLNNLSEAKHS